ncbi:MAG: hypothetical protein ABFD54_15555 [Armatimonadota bacterium]|nr:YjbH domain-containing protein [bacterium]
MKKMMFLLTMVLLVVGGASASYAAASIYGMSGLIETPNDVYLAPMQLGLTVNYVADVDDGNLFTFGGAFGVTPDLEVSAVGADSSRNDADMQGLFNAKWRVLRETADRPAISIGIVDVANGLDEVNPRDDSPSGFLMLSKNLTSTGLTISGNRPLIGTLGFGTGLYKGAFIGLEYLPTPRVELMFEYLTNGIKQDTTFNGGIRYYMAPQFSVMAGALDFQSFFAGVDYRLPAF